MQLADVRCVDLLAGEIARLVVVAVGVQEVVRVLRRSAELLLRDRRRGRARRPGCRRRARSPGRSPCPVRRTRTRQPTPRERCLFWSLPCFPPKSRRRSVTAAESGFSVRPRRELLTLRLPFFLSTQGNLSIGRRKIIAAARTCADCLRTVAQRCTGGCASGCKPHSRGFSTVWRRRLSACGHCSAKWRLDLFPTNAALGANPAIRRAAHGAAAPASGARPAPRASGRPHRRPA